MNEEVFPVRRRSLDAIGWTVLLIAGISVALGGPWMADPDSKAFIAGLIGVSPCLYLLKTARNLTEIRVSDQHIRFLPVDVSLNIADLKSYSVPSWAERHDTPPNSFSQISFETNEARALWVVSVLVQTGTKCVINVGGSEADKVLESSPPGCRAKRSDATVIRQSCA